MIRKSGYRFSLGTNAKRLPGDHAQTKKIERDDDSRKSHPALVKDPDDHGQYRYLADNQRCHFDRVVRASLNHPRPDDEVHSAVMRIRCKPKDTQLWARRRYFEFQI
jgi:hypothetical protein